MNKQRDTRELVEEAYEVIRSQKPWTHPGPDIPDHRVLLRVKKSMIDRFGFLNLFTTVEARILAHIYRYLGLYFGAARQKRSGVYVEVGGGVARAYRSCSGISRTKGKGLFAGSGVWSRQEKIIRVIEGVSLRTHPSSCRTLNAGFALEYQGGNRGSLGPRHSVLII